MTRARRDACGWPAGEVAEDVILSRLSGYKTRGYALNRERVNSQG